MGISIGLGYTAPIWIGAALTALALIVMVLATLLAGRRDVHATSSEPVSGDSDTLAAVA